MSGITLGGDPRRLITHLALYGLAAICSDAGHTDLRISWTTGMSPRPHLNIDPDAAGRIVQAHASKCDWVKETITLGGTPRGLMSPRLTAIATDDGWQELQNRRHKVLDTLTTARADLDLRFLGALGEPAYWRFDRTGKRLQDDAANRLEMQPRNTGAEFIGSRLSKIAEKVAERTHSQILDGLLGHHVRDELSGDAPDSRSATGLDAPGPADNTVVWCALWGISQIHIALRTGGAALTSVSVRNSRSEHFAVPLWRIPWHPARLRSILASAQFQAVAAALAHGQAPDDIPRLWLNARGVTAIITFPVTISGSDKAPERRAGTGQLHPIGRRQ
ncbi:hypothetical protein OHB01_25960 [Microbispora hainanensis]|uniref:hypothetical protein n=1 Tax=Microbispora TaxID=2005 RepID=UPI00115774B8|nr:MULTISPECIES: hypothetical protein [Microbispora]NJP29989.1 hypothetical protein [Microbispora sp. CL1-1]TQS03497.1 hypothetical protein FLW53_38540 [Microbispora sp. SCL1-1]